MSLPPAACRRRRRQHLHDLPAFFGATEENRGVVEIKSGQPWIDRPARAPVEGAGRVEPDAL